MQKLKAFTIMKITVAQKFNTCNMHKRLIQILVLAVLCLAAKAQTWTTIDIHTPGTLEAAILGKTADQLTNTRINGALNWLDLKFMAGGNESLSAIQNLDLRGVTLIPGGECYAQKNVFGSASAMATVNISFYLSDDNTLTYNTTDWLGTYRIYGHARNNCFAGVFGGFSALTTVYLPEYMTEIGPAAFCANKSLRNVVMGNKVRKIGQYAFAETEIKTLDNFRPVTYIDNRAFIDSGIELFSSMENVETIGYQAFEGSKIKQADLPNIKFVDEYAFSESALQSASLGTSIKVIPEKAFNCPSMTSFNCPESIDSIGPFALTSPWLKAKPAEKGIIYVNNIACALAQDFPSEILIKEGTTHIVDNFFEGSGVALNNSQEFIFLTIPKSMRYIGESAFAACLRLASVTFAPGGNLYIKDRAFATDNYLNVKEFAEGIKYMGFQAFPTVKNVVWRLPSTRLDVNGRPFSDVKTVTIGAETDSIPARLFDDLEDITDITFEDRPADRLLYIGDNAFSRPYRESPLVRNIHNFPAYVSYVGDNNFASDYAPAHFDSPVDLTHVREIGKRAFLHAADAFPGDTLVLPEGLEKIGEMAFGGLACKHVAVNCKSLDVATNIFIEPSHANWSYTPIFNTAIKTVSVSKNVCSLPNHIFGGCVELERVEFEDRPRENPVPLSIGSCIVGGFIGEGYRVDDIPSKVSEWELPYGTVSMSSVAFDQAARAITIPATFKEFTVSESVNRYPYSHEMTIYCHAPEVPTPSRRFSYAFDLSNTLPPTVTVYVPARYLSIYQADKEWGTAKILPFADDLLEINGVQYAEVGADDEGFVLLKVVGIDDAISDAVVDIAFEHKGDKYRTIGINQNAFAGKTLNSFSLTHSREWQPASFTFGSKSFAGTTLTHFNTEVCSDLIFETESFHRFKLLSGKFKITTDATIMRGAFLAENYIDFVFDNAKALGHLTLHQGALRYFRNLEFYGKTLECIADTGNEPQWMSITGTLVLGNTTTEVIGVDYINNGGVEIDSYAVVPPVLSGFSAEKRSCSRYYYPRCAEDRYAKNWQGFFKSSSINGYCIAGPEGSYFGYADEIADIHDFVLGTTDKTDAVVPTYINLYGEDLTINNVWPYSFWYSPNLRTLTFGSLDYPERSLYVWNNQLEPYQTLDRVNVINAKFHPEAFASIGNAIKSIRIAGAASCENGLKLPYCSIKNVIIDSECTDATIIGWDGEYTGQYGPGNLAPDVVIESYAMTPPAITPCPDEIYHGATVTVPAPALDAYLAHPVWGKFVRLNSAGVTDVQYAPTAQIIGIFDTTGRYFGTSAEGLPAGIYIIRYSNGSATRSLIR